MLECEGNRWFCNNCSHDWCSVAERRAKALAERSRRFSSLDDLVARTGLRRDELVTLADIGALNAFGYDRRSALWQAERAIRPGGELFDVAEGKATAENAETAEIFFGKEFSAISALSAVASPVDGVTASPQPLASSLQPPAPSLQPPVPSPLGDSEGSCPLKPMTEAERLVADYGGMGLSTGRHPMALKRDELAMRGILRACDLRTARQGRRVRVAGMVITRQRPGTAKGFVFLTLEDETGIANIIVRPDLFARDRLVIIEEPFLIVDGVLQSQDGVTSIRAEEITGLHSGPGSDVDFDAHDFY